MRDNKAVAAAQIIILYVLPVLLLAMGIIPVRYRFIVLAVATLMVACIIRKEHWTLKELGIRFDDFRKSALVYTLFTIAAVLGVLLLAGLLKKQVPENWHLSPHFSMGIFILASSTQEFIFRGFLIPKLKTLFRSALAVILLNAVLFGFIHIIYPHALEISLLSSVLGLGFASIYYYYPNLILISLSHSIINFVAVMHCFATFIEGCK